MPLLIVALGIALLLFLIIVLKMNSFLALVLVALGVGLAQGMPVEAAAKSMQVGVGDTLGSLALILGFGAMFGALLAESGAAQQITDWLVRRFGRRYVQWAMVIAGFILGVPMFFSVAFVMIIPVIFAIARSTQLPLLYVGLPMVSALSVTHGFLPPHPAPTTIVALYKADVSLVFFYGLILSIPTILLAGPLFASTLRHIKAEPRADLYRSAEVPAQAPGFAVSLLTALIPVLLMGMAAMAKLALPESSMAYRPLTFAGDPAIALLIAVLVGMYTLGWRTGRRMSEVTESLTDSVKGIAMILLIIGGGGAFKQVLIDSGVGDYVAATMKDVAVSPLILAWLIAAALRIALGSATVAALTAGGIAAPLIATTSVSPELLVLATGAGSLTFSQVNDTGFWLFKEYFNLSIADTFRSWTMMETIISVIGLVGCLVMEQFI